MAKGLKVGDMVTVRKAMSLAQKSEAYQAGLKRLKPGIVGKVVDTAQGRSVVVDFEGRHVTLASQRLEKATESSQKTTDAGTAKSGGGKKGQRGPRTGKARVAASATATTVIPDERSLIDYANPQFITSVANKLLTTSGLEPDPETVVMQIKLSDLPVGIREQVRSLMHAKLALPPEMASAATAGSSTGRRRGRPPKKQS
jgi:hypothetical protein